MNTNKNLNGTRGLNGQIGPIGANWGQLGPRGAEGLTITPAERDYIMRLVKDAAPPKKERQNGFVSRVLNSVFGK